MTKRVSKRYTLVLACGMLLSSQSCKVDIEPTDRYTEESVWVNPANIELYVNGMYSEFQTFAFGNFPVGYSNATDALTDIEKFTSSVLGNGTVNSLATDPSKGNAGGPMLNYWDAGYTRIRRVNEFLSGLKTYGKVDETTRQSYEAEARFIRGYCYFWLAKLHGSVVLLDNIDQYLTMDHARSSEDDVWNFIAADFDFASQHLPKDWPAAQVGKATKGAAYGMLARTWLYAASVAEYDKKQYNQDPLTGVPASKATEYYQHAADAAAEVVKLANEGYYELSTDFASIFTNKNTREAIFRIDYAAPQLKHNLDLGYAPPGDAPGQCLVYGVPTAELVNEFEMNDGSSFSWSNAGQAADPYANREDRFYGTVLYNGESWKGRTINTTATSDNTIEGFIEYASVPEPKRTVTGYYQRKFLNPVAEDFVQFGSTQSWIELRYAEILLIQAEAKVKLNDLSGAADALDALRTKRGLPETTAVTADQLMRAIEHERIVELAFEGQRYWDLRRWRKAHIVLNNVRFSGHKIEPNGGGGYNYQPVSCDNTDRKFTTDLYYLPIPVAELQRNAALTQIKGW